MATSQSERLQHLVIGHALLVVLVGLIAGLMLVFALLDAVTIWPLPTWNVTVPGSIRGWSAAHVGGILNGVMIIVFALLMTRLALTGARLTLVAWGLVITGWGNTLFYWAGNLADNRGLSVGTTPFGEGDLAGALAFLGGGVAMIFTFIVVYVLARAAFRAARVSA
ncbi:MAG: hypothetical protein P8Y69_14830 [Gammaproteobacteria bacterium]|jgi:hypothetical protein